MKIRDAIPSDASKIANIQVNGWKSAYKNIFPDTFLNKLSYEDKTPSIKKWLENLEKTTRVYVAEPEINNIVGFAVGGLEREVHPLYNGELWGIYIKKEKQRCGIGTRLVKKVVQHLLNLNISTMIVWVLKDNPYRKFYEKLNGKFLKEQEKEFHGFSRKIVSYGWSDVKTIIKNY